MDPRAVPLVIVVGSGGVGKTTLAAALGVGSAGAGRDTLVMTFDPSLRLRSVLGVDAVAAEQEAEVPFAAAGRLCASLLDARATFDRLIARYAPDQQARERILRNRFYDNLSGHLAGVLEYMASERLLEVARDGAHERIVLDTPPTRQALDFLGAPDRIVSFLDSGALRIALKPWFDDDGQLRATSRLGPLGRNVEGFFDRVVGLELLRDMAEFFQAFSPLYDGFRERAVEVQRLLRAPETLFVLVSAPGRRRVADTLFFARRLTEAGYRLGPVVVNRIHPAFPDAGPSPAQLAGAAGDGRALLRWLGERDRASVAELRSLLGGSHPLVEVPLLPDEPTDLESLAALGGVLGERLDAALARR
ncbi:MAG TPA: ArsA-related P-loop ATPase [Thermoanaerobaculales bacterium]|nr:ArsA-related P-loop ATPase [Thermoanaerobaculales bacterium]HPA82688.1 ArsA-related P-loop ATPase [Thermoanaerobaculales bacterium]HQL30151.1 ArsA-related P-loop ATPase [Thermoanaerobaculales bacterium]HQP44400.1 ArsA-related P-loop ATPase [Thermoanaerobaculales bacterium]